MSFNAQFDQDGAWQHEPAGRLKLFMQVREQQQTFARGLKAVKRIARTAFSLDARIAKLDQQHAMQKAFAAQLADLTMRIPDFQFFPGAVNPPCDPPAICAAVAAAA